MISSAPDPVGRQHNSDERLLSSATSDEACYRLPHTEKHVHSTYNANKGTSAPVKHTVKLPSEGSYILCSTYFRYPYAGGKIHVVRVTIDGFWIDDRIYWTL
jgi:hypothetical protein